MHRGLIHRVKIILSFYVTRYTQPTKAVLERTTTEGSKDKDFPRGQQRRLTVA